MVMRTGQQAGLLVQEPALDRSPGTWRAHPMCTGIVPHPCYMSLGTGLDMPTEKRCTTGKHRLHRTTHIARQRMVRRVRFITLVQNRLSADLV